MDSKDFVDAVSPSRAKGTTEEALPLEEDALAAGAALAGAFLVGLDILFLNLWHHR